jgi:3-oxoacyl-[acyl-carrier-protein] synthase-3
MAKSKLKGARIKGVVTCVPSTEKCIDDEIELFGGNAKQIARLKKTIGLDRRRVVEDGTTALDLCAAATERLFKAASLDPATIDGMLFVTQTADYPQPCNAAVLHGRLGLSKNCAALDINLGCSGYVYGLWLAHMMVSTGACQRVLLLAGDTLSRLVHPGDRSVAPLFGDGGSATLVEACADSEAWFSLNTDGSGYEKLMVPAGGMRTPRGSETQREKRDEEGNVRSLEHLFMDGPEIFNFSITEEPQSVREMLDFAGLDVGAIRHFVFHQANRYILGNIAKRLNLDPARVPMKTVEMYGNQSSTSIPCALCYELGDLLKGPVPQKLLMSGFGVGLSWASAILEIGNLPVCEVIELGRPN